MSSRKLDKSRVRHAASMLAATLLAAAVAVADEPERGVFVLTSTNNPSANEVVVFKLDTAGTPSLSLVDMLPTQGKGGAGGNAGILQFKDDRGAVGNYGSNSVSRIVRHDDFISIEGTIGLAPNCVKPDSVALTTGPSLRGRRELRGESCVAVRQRGWQRRRAHRPFGCADRGRQGLGGCHHDLRIPPAAASHAGWGAQWVKCRRNAPEHRQQYPARGRVLGRCPGIHAGPQSRQLRHREQESGRFSDNRTDTAISHERPLLGGQGAGERLVHGQFPRTCHLHILHRRPRRGVLQIDTLCQGRRRTSRYPRIRSGSPSSTVPVAAHMSRYSPSTPTATSPLWRHQAPSVSPASVE